MRLLELPLEEGAPPFVTAVARMAMGWWAVSFAALDKGPTCMYIDGDNLEEREKWKLWG